ASRERPERARLMIVQFECPECHKTLRVKEQYAGKRARCVHCGKPVWIPRQHEQVQDITVDRSAPRRRYEASASAETFDLVSQACGTVIRVARQDAGTRIQCTNDQCMGMVLVVPPAPSAEAKDGSVKPRPAAPAPAQKPGAATEAMERVSGFVRAG